MHGKRFAAILLALSAVGAQELTTFDVASVKVSGPDSKRDSGGGPGTSDPGQYHFFDATLRDLLAMAYQMQYFQLVSKTSLENGRFDVVAKIPAGATRDQFRTMMQNLLAERFHVKLHRETRDFPSWELVVAKSGSKLKESQPASATDDPSRPSVDSDGFPILTPGKPGFAGRFTMIDGFVLGRLTAAQQPVSVLTRENYGDSNTPPIVDHTGLTGKYDFRLEFSRETPASLNSPEAKTPPAPDIFTALQQQLGLQFVPKKLPFDVLVIESFDAFPMEN